jgi:hypothetical protein
MQRAKDCRIATGYYFAGCADAGNEWNGNGAVFARSRSRSGVPAIIFITAYDEFAFLLLVCKQQIISLNR